MVADEKKSFSIEKSPAKHTIIVLSGKGGVGKSTIAANLAVAFTLQGYKTGLLDIDFHGPSIPKLLGLEGKKLAVVDKRIIPAGFGDLKVMSVDFMLEKRTDAVIWRGPLKMSFTRQLLEEVEWGDLDFLIVDSPPGTGDEPLSIVQLIPDPTGSIIVTTSQEVSTTDVKRSITFCNTLNLPVLGVIENMSGFACPHCGKKIEIFGSGGGERMAEEMNVKFLSRIPFDTKVMKSGESGKPFVYFDNDAETTGIFSGMVSELLENVLGEENKKTRKND